jgi:hypothetical protein
VRLLGALEEALENLAIGLRVALERVVLDGLPLHQQRFAFLRFERVGETALLFPCR